ncbi:MAG: hypothetical protein KGD67_05130 [Candidatus Lokiarchaeota archaeon]|nr:hypothetical protein [Candidatus Lokiarchaeota archaeon]
MSWELEKNNFCNFIIENRVIGFFNEPITLKSGRKSYWYVNWRTVAEDVYLLNSVSDYLLLYVKHLRLKPDCFYGVPEGATKIGLITQFKWAFQDKKIKPGMYTLSMGRGKPKEHGDLKDKFFLGIPKGNVILLEDTTTTGGSMLRTIDDLAKLDVKIIAAIGLTNRNEIRDDGFTVKEAINNKGVQYHSMSDATDLLPKLKPNPTVATHIENYFKRYGKEEIKF